MRFQNASGQYRQPTAQLVSGANETKTMAKNETIKQPINWTQNQVDNQLDWAGMSYNGCVIGAVLSREVSTTHKTTISSRLSIGEDAPVAERMPVTLLSAVRGT